MPSSIGQRNRKQQQYIYRHCQLCHVTTSYALIVGVCVLMLPMLELATEHVQLTTTCHINHVPPPRINTRLTFKPHPFAAISQQCATSHGPPEPTIMVKYQTFFPLQSLSCCPHAAQLPLLPLVWRGGWWVWWCFYCS